MGILPFTVNAFASFRCVLACLLCESAGLGVGNALYLRGLLPLLGLNDNSTRCYRVFSSVSLQNDELSAVRMIGRLRRIPVCNVDGSGVLLDSIRNLSLQGVA